jgi:hypothetical protein
MQVIQGVGWTPGFGFTVTHTVRKSRDHRSCIGSSWFWNPVENHERVRCTLQPGEILMLTHAIEIARLARELYARVWLWLVWCNDKLLNSVLSLGVAKTVYKLNVQRCEDATLKGDCCGRRSAFRRADRTVCPVAGFGHTSLVTREATICW